METPFEIGLSNLDLPFVGILDLLAMLECKNRFAEEPNWMGRIIDYIGIPIKGLRIGEISGQLRTLLVIIRKVVPKDEITQQRTDALGIPSCTDFVTKVFQA